MKRNCRSDQAKPLFVTTPVISFIPLNLFSLHVVSSLLLWKSQNALFSALVIILNDIFGMPTFILACEVSITLRFVGEGISYISRLIQDLDLLVCLLTIRSYFSKYEALHQSCARLVIPGKAGLT